MRIPIVLATLATAWTLAPANEAVTRAAASRATVFPSGGNIPADHVRLFYTTSRMEAPRLYRLEGTTKVNVPYDSEVGTLGVWITPTTEQPLGTQLVFETEDAHARYSITEKRPALPKQLGTLTASTQRAQLPVDDGISSELADVSYADVRITLSDEAMPFSALWHYQLYVDDEPALERIYTKCNDTSLPGASAVSAGVHVLHLAAQLGDEAPIASPDARIELRCDATSSL